MAATITIVCPKCSNRMKASAEHVGREGRCPQCKSLIPIQPVGEAAGLPSLRPEDPTIVRRSGDSLGATEVSTWLAGLFGASLTVILYAAVFLPLRNTVVGKLFIGDTPIPPIITLITCWGFGALLLKFIAVKRQLSYADSELDLIPLEIGMQITPANVDQFINNIAELPLAEQSSILGRRIQGALEHFKSRHSVPEVQQYLASRAEIDASQVDSGYALLRAFIWAVPILGFIGTVLGISIAVGGLDVTLESEAGGGALLEGMKQVTGGLATAFDTTLIALCMAIVLLFPTESLRKTEYTMLDRIETFANEWLLRRMSDSDDDLSSGVMPEIVRKSLESAFHEHERWLVQWQAQVAQLGELIGSDFETAIGKIQERISESEKQRVQAAEGLGQLMQEFLADVQESSKQHDAAASNFHGQFQRFVEAAAALQQTLAKNVEFCGEFLEVAHTGDGSLSGKLEGLKQQVDQMGSELDAMKGASSAPANDTLPPKSGPESEDPLAGDRNRVFQPRRDDSNPKT